MYKKVGHFFMRYNFITSFPECFRGFPGGTRVKEPPTNEG